jgi:pyridinium-3,5-biscarboxylic acid mononucleotide synthase
MEDNSKLHQILNKIKNQEISPEQGTKLINSLYLNGVSDLEFDHGRAARTSIPEVVFCNNKSIKQIKEIFSAACAKKISLLGTKVSQEKYQAIKNDLPSARYNPISRTLVCGEPQALNRASSIAIVSAGTSDLPIVEEAYETALYLGMRAEKYTDIGVAGIHRLFGKIDKINQANVIITVAGMEGALASVIAGLSDKPVIAVPTSVGYGASFDGLAALLAMLNSCAPGVSVVNIDNGFGAACQAALINGLVKS